MDEVQLCSTCRYKLIEEFKSGSDRQWTSWITSTALNCIFCMSLCEMGLALLYSTIHLSESLIFMKGVCFLDTQSKHILLDLGCCSENHLFFARRRLGEEEAYLLEYFLVCGNICSNRIMPFILQCCMPYNLSLILYFVKWIIENQFIIDCFSDIAKGCFGRVITSQPPSHPLLHKTP